MKKVISWSLSLLAFMVATTGWAVDAFDYLSNDAAMVGYINSEMVRDSGFEANAKKLNKLISDKNGDGYDFSEHVSKFSSAVVSADSNLSINTQAILLTTELSPEELFTLLESSTDYKLIRQSVSNQPAGIYPDAALNKSLRGKVKIGVVYITDNIVYIGDINNATNMITTTPVDSDLQSQVFAFAPEDAFAMVTIMPKNVKFLTAFLGGVDQVNLCVSLIDSGDGIKIYGELTCQNEKIAQDLALNLKKLVPTMLSLLLRDNIALALSATMGLDTKAEGNTLYLNWELSGYTVNGIFDYAESSITKRGK